jgi:hypothetical protein
MCQIDLTNAETTIRLSHKPKRLGYKKTDTQNEKGNEMTAKTVKTAKTVDLVSLIAELVDVKKAKADLANRESAIRKVVLTETGNIATVIADPKTGEVIAEITESVRRSVNDWEAFEITYPEAYEALVKFTDILTLNTK